MKLLVIHGPNLNLLGQRETSIYGDLTLDQLNQMITDEAKTLAIETDFFQDNHEGNIVDKLQTSQAYDGIIINPAAYSHTSIAIRDAIAAIETPVIEVHISNIHKREAFRQVCITAPVCVGQITGFGPKSYVLALQYFNLTQTH